MLHIFKKDPYPHGLQWNDPVYTLFRDFQLDAPDCEILIRLVKDHMSDKGNTGEIRRRLLAILNKKHSKQFFLVYLRRRYPYTWKIRWKWKKLRESFHRSLKTRKFKRIVADCRLADEALAEVLAEEQMDEL